jgi:hypothetical protein
MARHAGPDPEGRRRAELVNRGLPGDRTLAQAMVAFFGLLTARSAGQSGPHPLSGYRTVGPRNRTAVVHGRVVGERNRSSTSPGYRSKTPSSQKALLHQRPHDWPTSTRLAWPLSPRCPHETARNLVHRDPRQKHKSELNAHRGDGRWKACCAQILHSESRLPDRQRVASRPQRETGRQLDVSVEVGRKVPVVADGDRCISDETPRSAEESDARQSRHLARFGGVVRKDNLVEMMPKSTRVRTISESDLVGPTEGEVEGRGRRGRRRSGLLRRWIGDPRNDGVDSHLRRRRPHGGRAGNRGQLLTARSVAGRPAQRLLGSPEACLSNPQATSPGPRDRRNPLRHPISTVIRLVSGRSRVRIPSSAPGGKVGVIVGFSPRGGQPSTTSVGGASSLGRSPALIRGIPWTLHARRLRGRRRATSPRPLAMKPVARTS